VANANGDVVITVKVKDDGGLVNVGADDEIERTFTVSITAVNDQTDATDESIDASILEDVTANADFTDELIAAVVDVDLDPLLNIPFTEVITIVVVGDPNAAKGSATIGSVLYNPNGAFNNLAVGETENDVFSYTAEDQGGSTVRDTALVTVTIVGENDAPTATDNSYTTNEDETAFAGNVRTDDTGNGADSDPDTSDTTEVTELNGVAADVGVATVLPSGATLTLNIDGSFTYDASTSTTFNALAVAEDGNDSFTYKLQDRSGVLPDLTLHGTSDTATVSLTINGRNDAPTAGNDSYNVRIGDTLVIPATGQPDLLDNDSDPDVDGNAPDDFLTTRLVTNVATGLAGGGTLSNTAVGNLNVGDVFDGSFTWTPPFFPVGSDSFTYVAVDNNAGPSADSNIATVDITVITPVLSFISPTHLVGDFMDLTLNDAAAFTATVTVDITSPVSKTVTLNNVGAGLYAVNLEFCDNTTQTTTTDDDCDGTPSATQIPVTTSPVTTVTAVYAACPVGPPGPIASCTAQTTTEEPGLLSASVTGTAPILLTPDTVSLEDGTGIRVLDTSKQNTVSGETVTAILRTDSYPWGLKLTLTEDADTGEFSSITPTQLSASATNANRLNAAVGDTIFASYPVLFTNNFFLRDDSSSQFIFGFPGDSIQISGDWDNDDFDTIGIYQPSTAAWYLRNEEASFSAFGFGFPYDTVPIVGKWDNVDATGGTNPTETVGAYQVSTSAFFLRDEAGGFSAFGFGFPEDSTALVGDWDNDGTDSIGVYQKSTSAFFLRDEGGTFVQFPFGFPGDSIPIVGKWDNVDATGGTNPTETVGVYQISTSIFFLRDEAGGFSAFTFGFVGDSIPIVGKWDNVDATGGGNPAVTIGVFQPSTNIVYIRDEAGGFSSFGFGFGDDTIPIIGDWDDEGIDKFGVFRPGAGDVSTTGLVIPQGEPLEDLFVGTNVSIDCDESTTPDGICADWIKTDHVEVTALPGATYSSPTCVPGDTGATTGQNVNDDDCANSQRIDIYLEYDWCTNRDPGTGVFTTMQANFADLPIVNLDGSTGINIHVQRGEDIGLFADEIRLFSSTVGTQPTYDQIKGDSFGTASEPASAEVLAGKQQFFHYVLFCNQSAEFNDSPGSGDFGGPNIFIAMNPNNGPALTDDQVVRILQHEMGLNLKLLHGGGDSVNYKPNYLSIMNYNFQFTKTFDGATELDTGFPPIFSSGALPTIYETSLDETVPVVPATTHNGAVLKTIYGGFIGGVEQTAILADTGVAVDLDRNAGTALTNFAQNIHWRDTPDGQLEPLIQMDGYNDYALIQPNFRAGAEFLFAAPVGTGVPGKGPHSWHDDTNDNIPTGNPILQGQAPNANDQTVLVTDTGDVQITLTGSSSRNFAMQFDVSNEVNGSVLPLSQVVAAPTPPANAEFEAIVTFTPGAAFTSGSFDFTLEDLDNNKVSNTATVNVILVSDIVADLIIANTETDDPIIVTLTATHPGGAPLTFALSSLPEPAKGFLADTFLTNGPNSATILYTPAPGFAGTASFTYSAKAVAPVFTFTVPQVVGLNTNDCFFMELFVAAV